MSAEKIRIDIEKLRDYQDRAWLEHLWEERWGGLVMVSRGRVHRLKDLDALIARKGGERVGAATFLIDRGECEVTSLDALESGTGVGSVLLAEVERVARETGCARVWLITTNDNVDALRFYQRRGYRIRNVHAGAVDQARAQKPSIPEVGNYGIRIRDEIELEKRLR